MQISAEYLNAYRTVEGRRLALRPHHYGTLYLVVGNENSLEDACYFWNLRAISGIDRVRWIALNDLDSFLKKREVAYMPILILTSASGAYHKEIKTAIQEMKMIKGRIRYWQARVVLRSMGKPVWQGESKREHIATEEGEFVVPVISPSYFEILYPPRRQRWVMDLRIVRDNAIGTEGFILPNLPCLSDIITPGQSIHTMPRILQDVFSLQVTPERIDRHIRLRVPTNWEVIQAIFMQYGYKIRLSDQGNYMSRTLALFGDLPTLSELLHDARAIIIFDEFMKHHRTGKRIIDGNHYRRSLTLDDMRKVVINLTGHKSRKNKDEDFRFVDQLVRELIRLGAIHSGYMLDCSQCSLEDWYPIDEVAENFRCRRCLANEVRPLSPPIFFRLNEALYQAYAHNFTVPALVLDVLRKSTNTSFIFSPQIKIGETDQDSHEIDIIALCDGKLVMGEAKSTDRIKSGKIDLLESIALRVKAHRIILGTTSHRSCQGINCVNCSKNNDYADNAFTHSSTKEPQFWGTREHIKDLRNRLFKRGIKVTSICAKDIALGAMSRNSPKYIFVPTRQLQ